MKLSKVEFDQLREDADRAVAAEEPLAHAKRLQLALREAWKGILAEHHGPSRKAVEEAFEDLYAATRHFEMLIEERK